MPLQELMIKILGKSVPHMNKSPRKRAWALSPSQHQWVHDFYRKDFSDPAIRMALEGKVRRGSLATIAGPRRHHRLDLLPSFSLVARS